jgi:hypothetical protein
MLQADFEKWLGEHEGWAWQIDKGGLNVANAEYDTITHISWAALAREELDVLVTLCKQGRDVTGMTRVTGYFSKTSGWNRGKLAELKDRHRERGL